MKGNFLEGYPWVDQIKDFCYERFQIKLYHTTYRDFWKKDRSQEQEANCLQVST